MKIMEGLSDGRTVGDGGEGGLTGNDGRTGKRASLHIHRKTKHHELERRRMKERN